MVAGAIPPALSVTVIDPPSTTMPIAGATPISSQASSALSTSSLRITSVHCSTAWPVCSTSSLCEQNSNNLLVLKTCRSRI